MSIDLVMNMKSDINIDFYRKVVRKYLELVRNMINQNGGIRLGFVFRIVLKPLNFGQKKLLRCQKEKNRMFIG